MFTNNNVRVVRMKEMKDKENEKKALRNARSLQIGIPGSKTCS